MKLITSLLGFALLAASQFLLTAGSSIPEAPAGSGSAPGIDGYNRGVATFTGNIHGQPYEIKGTITDVVAHLQNIHPDVTFNASNFDGVIPDTAPVAKRAKILPPLCLPIDSQGWEEAWVTQVDACIHYMEGVGGRVWFDGKSCGRLCCIGQSLVEVCNDKPYRINPDLRYIASYAYDLRHKCYHQSIFPIRSWDTCGGQLFDSDGYNVIVRHPWGINRGRTTC